MKKQQYSQRLCLRIDGVPSVYHGVFEKVKEICAESNLEIPGSNLDRAHRIGKPYFEKIKKVKCKSIIVHFNTFVSIHCCIGQKRYKTEERVQNQIRFKQKALYNAF